MFEGRVAERSLAIFNQTVFYRNLCFSFHDFLDCFELDCCFWDCFVYMHPIFSCFVSRKGNEPFFYARSGTT